MLSSTRSKTAAPVRPFPWGRLIFPDCAVAPTLLFFEKTTAMSIELIVMALFLSIIAVLYSIVGWRRIIQCMSSWFQQGYWTDYNAIEFLAWMAKALVIIPGLVLGKEIWELHFLTLLTSSLLIWVSMRKMLPTLLVFNTLWIAISSTIVVRNLL
ncbi:hypothetical protein [Pseudomonas sp. NPDC086251]|uniref:hypothetical protein n=1 Tax=Pseudomonas sp. NPDC086251 TaxID=3364431 RepID=UPI0038362C02